MPKNWSIPRTTYDALGKLSIQRSPAIAKAVWEAKADPTRIIRAMESRLSQALATATATATASASAKAKACAAAEAAAGAGAAAGAAAGAGAEEQASVLHGKTVPGAKLINGDEYVRVSVSYPPKTAEAVEYLAGLFRLSYEETVRLSLEAYIKHL